MSRIALTFLVTLIATAALPIAAGLSGTADVGATVGRTSAVEWFLESSRRASVERRARSVVPPTVDEAMVRRGAARYGSACATCHGAPGVDPEGFATGMDPVPPDLRRVRLDAAEAFWVAKHGIGRTGMPAFGRSYSDHELWEIIAVVGRLPGMSAGEYADLVAAAPGPEALADGT